MKTRCRFFTAIILLAALHVSAQQSAPEAPPAKPAISVSIKAAADVVKTGSDVRVIVTTTNISDRPLKFLYVPHRYLPEDFAIGLEVWNGNDVLLQSRKHRDPSALISILGSSPLSSDTMQPGESQHYDDYEIVSKIFDLKSPGKYTIQVTRGDPTTGAQIKSNKVTVEVVR
jgi:hypothetical protein